MIHPQLATMLVYLFTDAAASARELQALLREACDDSLNCMSIDGDTSTNDTVLLLASGASGVRVRKKDVHAEEVLRGPDRSMPVACRADRQRRRRRATCDSSVRRAGEQPGRGVAGGADDRSLHARQNRMGWRRSELGTNSRCSRKVRRAHRSARACRFLLAVRKYAATASHARSTSGKRTAISGSRCAMFACNSGAAGTR